MIDTLRATLANKRRNSSIYHKLNFNFLAFLLITMALIPLSHAASNTISNTTLTIVGLPAGAQIPVRFAPNYTTVTYTATGYTTNITVYISASTKSTYSGKVPYQWQGQGQTISYNGVTYTMLPSTYTQLLNVGKDNILGFYVYLNSTLWNTNETAELKAANSSLANAKLMIARIQNSTAPIQYGNSKAMASGNYLKLGQKAKYADIISNSTTGANITFYTSNVIPNNTYLNEKVSNSIFNQAGNYTIGLSNNNGNVVVDGSLASSLVLSNKVNYTYEIKDMVNGTILANGYADAANTINIPFNYKIKVPKNDSLSNPIKLVSITFDAAGNGNYSSVDPTTYVIGTWTSQNNLINGFVAGSCVNYQNYIYCINGNYTKTVEAAPITNNVIGTWTVQNSLINDMNGGSCVNYQNYIYCADGNGGNTVEAAPITNNVIGTWTSQNSLINNFNQGSCVNYQNYIYCANGYPTFNTVEAAPINEVIYTSPTITISNNALTLDQGQSITFNGVISGGTAPYTVNVFVANAVTLGTDMLVNTIITSGTTWSNTITTNSLFPSNSPLQANVVLTDSHPTTVTSGYTSNFIVNPALSTPSISPSNPTIDNGQSVTFTSTWSGGTTDYTAKLYSSSTSSCSSGSTLVQTLSSLTSGSASFTAVSPTSTTYYCIFVTDSAYSSETTNSINSEVVVNSALGIPTLSSSPTLPSTQTTGNTITFTSSWSGGTSSYTANYLITNTITGNLLANALYTGITGTSNSFAWTIPSSDAGNTVQANVIITDSAYSSETTNSVKSGTLTIKNTDLGTLQITWFNSSVTTLTSQETQNQTLHTGSSFSIATWTNITGLAGNFFLFRINNTEKYYLNGTLLQGNALVANYSSQTLVNKQYCLPQGEYWIEWNETGNQLYLPFDVNAIIYEGTNQQGCQSHSGGGTPTQQITQTTTIRQPLSIAVNQTSILPTFPSIALECQGQMQGEQIMLGLFECTILNLPVIIILLVAVVLILAVREQKKRMRK